MTPARDPKQGNLFGLKAKHREQSKQTNPGEQSQESNPGEHSSRASHESNPREESWRAINLYANIYIPPTQIYRKYSSNQ